MRKNEMLMLLALKRILSKPTVLCLGTPEEDAAAAEAAAKAAEAEANKSKGGRTYTQQEFDSHAGAQRKKYEAESKKLAEANQKLANDVRLSQEERDHHQKIADELTAQFKTAEQLSAEKYTKLQREAKAKEEALAKRVKEAEDNYEKLLITTELADATSSIDEPIPGTLKKVLKADTLLVDELDEETKKPTGKKVVRVNLEDEKDGKPVTLVLPVKEALKRMQELPERFGIYFKGAGKGGMGGGNGSGGGSGGSMPKDTESYIAKRNANRAGK